jgi:hypothetical protein
MVDSITPTSGSSESTSGVQTTSTSSTGGSQGTGYNSKTTVSSMEELKKKAPEVYNEMIKGIALNMVTKMHRQQERLKQLMREWRRYSGIR